MRSKHKLNCYKNWSNWIVLPSWKLWQSPMTVSPITTFCLMFEQLGGIRPARSGRISLYFLNKTKRRHILCKIRALNNVVSIWIAQRFPTDEIKKERKMAAKLWQWQRRSNCSLFVYKLCYFVDEFQSRQCLLELNWTFCGEVHFNFVQNVDRLAMLVSIMCEMHNRWNRS